MNKRFLALALCAIMLLGICPVFTLHAEEDKEITIIAASDYQPKNGATAGKGPLKKILNSITASGVTKADALFYCGDYTHAHGSFSSSTEGVNAVSSVFSTVVKKKDMIFVQGNHDIMAGGSGLTLSGNNDPDSGDYGVFVINNDDYMWYNTDHNTIKNTAQNLIDYLNEKIEVGYDRPIFVLSHLPLHYSMRTKFEGDARYAMYLLDAMNKAAAKGLNIVYLFGHDHSNGWDDYLGGSCVYLKKGDNILVAKAGSTSNIVEKELKFTYMNAGYTGYYSNENGSDGTLTATVLKIKGDEITITRYDDKGVHNLKSAGVRNELKGESAYDPNPTVYTSPQTVKLTKVTDKTPINALVKVDRTGKAYKRVTNTALIEDGKEYVIVCNTATDYIVVPKIVTEKNSEGTRKGLDVEKTTAFSNATAYGDFDQYFFTFKKTNGGWYIMKGDKYLKMTETSAFAITLTLESEGTVFTPNYFSGGFYFKSGDSYWNYNARGLVNCHESKSGFYLYEYIGSSLEVQNGTAKINNNEVTGAKEGETVTLSANKLIGNMLFEKWEVLSGDISVEMKEGTATGTFKMPAGPVAVKAVYKEHTHAFTEKVENANYKAEGDSYYLSCSCGLSSKGTDSEKTFLPAALTPPTTPDEGENTEKNDSTTPASLPIIIAVVAVVVVAAGVTVTVVLLKKKKSATTVK